MTTTTCACGKAVKYKRSGECGTCYNRRWRADNPERVRESQVVCRKRYRENHREKIAESARAYRREARDRTDEMPVFDLTAPVSYYAAHLRVKYWRGPARIHTCTCGAEAKDWAYVGDSPHEQRGEVRRGPSREPSHLAWSPNPLDYVPRCRPCHIEMDRPVSAVVSQAA